MSSAWLCRFKYFWLKCKLKYPDVHDFVINFVTTLHKYYTIVLCLLDKQSCVCIRQYTPAMLYIAGLQRPEKEWGVM